jgi:rhodanese-related sulfurtransferase
VIRACLRPVAAWTAGRAGGTVSDMQHSPAFLRLVEETRPHVHEVTVEELRARLAANPGLVLMDVREESEWAAGRAAGACHLGKGILERDLEQRCPDPDAEIVMYCGGGFRSVLTCDAARRMGYRNIHSLIGGYKGLVAAGWSIER